MSESAEQIAARLGLPLMPGAGVTQVAPRVSAYVFDPSVLRLVLARDLEKSVAEKRQAAKEAGLKAYWATRRVARPAAPAVQAAPVESRSSSYAPRIRDMLSLGHSRADIIADLGLSPGGLGMIARHAGITLPAVPKVRRARESDARALARLEARADKAAARAAAVHARAAAKAAEQAARQAARIAANDAVNDRIVALFSSHSYGAIADDLGITRAGVAGRIRRLREAGRIGLVGARPAQDAKRPRVARTRRGRRAGPAQAQMASRNARVLELHKEGKTIEAITGEIGCSRLVAGRVLRAAGEVPSYAVARSTARHIAALPDLQARGLTTLQIAAEFGMTVDRLYALASRAGISLRRNCAVHPTKGQLSAAVAARRDMVAAMVRAGRTHADMIAQTGVSQATLSHDIAELGLSRQSDYQRNRPSFARRNPHLWGPVLSAWSGGRSVKGIARDMGLKWVDVRSVLKAARDAAPLKVAA